MATSTPKIRILKFVSKTCSACAAMSKARTVERFVEKHPEVAVVEKVISDESNEVPDGTEYEAAYALADGYGVSAVPTLIFEAQHHGEVSRVEGAVNLKQLEDEYEAAVAEYTELRENEGATPW